MNAVFGGLMSLRAQALRAAGVIVDGMIRDLGERRALGMSVSSLCFAIRLSTVPKANVGP